LLNAEALEVDQEYQPKKGTLSAKSDLGIIYLPMDGLVDIEAERVRLKKKVEEFDAEIGKVQAKLNNPGFTQKVPVEVLRDHEKRLVDWSEKRQHAQSALDALEG
jgi:valyl-tRNA synthetase